MNKVDLETARTIKDFGEQWQHFTENTGYYGSIELLADVIGSKEEVLAMKAKVVVDIGSGTGRIVNMLAEAGAGHIVALEPSDAFEVLLKNTETHRNIITYLRETGERLPESIQADYIISLGVIHHIPDPVPVLRAALKALKPNGKLIIWLYGKEGNRLYLFFALLARHLTKYMPHRSLVFFSRLLAYLASAYGAVCNHLTFFPMSRYFSGHFNKLNFESRVLTVYDQLNPAYAKYYTQAEAIHLVTSVGFKNIKTIHRHKYSWIVSGIKQ